MNIIKRSMTDFAGEVPNPKTEDLLNGELTAFDGTTRKMVGTGDIDTGDTISFSPKTIISGAGSIQLEEVHKISSGGENIFFKNLPSKINYSVPWMGIKDQSVVANQDSTGLILGYQRTYTENLLSVEQGGIISPTNITSYSSEITIPENVSIHGVRFRLAESLSIGNILHYAIYLGTDNSGVQIVQHDEKIKANYLAGDFYDLWLHSPAETYGGQVTFADIILETELGSGITSLLQVYATDVNPDEHYALVKLREFTNVDLISEEDVNSIVDSKVTSAVNYKGKYNATSNLPNLTVVPTGVLVGDFYAVEIAGTFFGAPVEVGDALISEVDNPQSLAHWTVLNRRLDAALIKSLYESNENTNVFTDSDKDKLEDIYSSGAINASFIEINSDTTLSVDTNFIVDTTNNVVNINIPFGVTNPFTIRDAYKKFKKPFTCIVNVKDVGGATIHSAELDKKDKGWVFYHNGVDWAYGEIGKGKVIVVSSDHIASTDFGVLVVDADDYTYEEIDGGILYKTTENMVDNPRSLVSKDYVDNLPSGGSSEYGELFITASVVKSIGVIPVPIEWDTEGVSLGITVSADNIDPIDDKITILSNGVHRVEFGGSVFLKKNETYYAFVYVNGTKFADLGEILTSLDNLTHPFGFSRPLSFVAGDYVQIYTSCTSTKDFSLSPGVSFNVEKI